MKSLKLLCRELDVREMTTNWHTAVACANVDYMLKLEESYGAN